MIKRFSVLYVGQIDLDNVGAEGTPADERRYTNQQLVQGYDNAVALAKHMDGLGFYCLWTAEHHFQREGYECFPNLILLGVHLAGITKRLKFGSAFNVVTGEVHNPPAREGVQSHEVRISGNDILARPAKR